MCPTRRSKKTEQNVNKKKKVDSIIVAKRGGRKVRLTPANYGRELRGKRGGAIFQLGFIFV